MTKALSKTPAAQDRDYKKALAKVLFEAVQTSHDILAPQGTVSGEFLPHLSGDLFITFRARVDHGGERGQKYHVYKLTLSEVGS